MDLYSFLVAMWIWNYEVQLSWNLFLSTVGIHDTFWLEFNDIKEDAQAVLS